MVVNSLAFLWFFLAVLVIYYICQQNSKLQNGFLLSCSYWFYGQISWKMAGLLAVLSIVFWLLGLGVDKSIKKNKEKAASWLTNIAVIIGVGALFYFKYLNFFAESFVTAASLIGIHLSWTTIKLLVPVGLSFFSFKLMSYVLDIYHGKITHEKNFIDYANFIAFFPTILSGPIDRPKPFLKQLKQSRLFDSESLMKGFRMVLWGMFLKMCIADRLDIYISAILNNYNHHSAISIIFAALLYPLQMYADFGGYSEMAIGVGLMLGFKVAPNFKRPFFAINISEYWRRWHMSLTSWLTDYVFMPCNIRLREWGIHGTIVAIMINMIFVGLWHGANWTFFVFGVYHGLLFVPLMLSGQFFKKSKIQTTSKGWPMPKFIAQMIGTYLLVMIGQFIFRANSIGEVVDMSIQITRNLSGELFIDYATMLNAFICIIALVYVDIRDEWFPNYRIRLPKWVDNYRWELTTAIEIVAIALFGVFDSNQFIYFQF